MDITLHLWRNHTDGHYIQLQFNNKERFQQQDKGLKKLIKLRHYIKFIKKEIKRGVTLMNIT